MLFGHAFQHGCSQARGSQARGSMCSAELSGGPAAFPHDCCKFSSKLSSVCSFHLCGCPWLGAFLLRNWRTCYCCCSHYPAAHLEESAGLNFGNWFCKGSCWVVAADPPKTGLSSPTCLLLAATQAQHRTIRKLIFLTMQALVCQDLVSSSSSSHRPVLEDSKPALLLVSPQPPCKLLLISSNVLGLLPHSTSANLQPPRKLLLISSNVLGLLPHSTLANLQPPFKLLLVSSNVLGLLPHSALANLQPPFKLLLVSSNILGLLPHLTLTNLQPVALSLVQHLFLQHSSLLRQYKHQQHSSRPCRTVLCLGLHP